MNEKMEKRLGLTIDTNTNTYISSGKCRGWREVPAPEELSAIPFPSACCWPSQSQSQSKSKSHPLSRSCSRSRPSRILLQIILSTLVGAIFLYVYLKGDDLRVGRLLEHYRGQSTAVSAAHSNGYEGYASNESHDSSQWDSENKVDDGAQDLRTEAAGSNSNPNSNSESNRSTLVKRGDHVISISNVQGCPDVEPSATTTNTTGPNGSLFFLSCGISDKKKTSRWSPPNVKISDLIVWANGSWTDNGSLFAGCAPFFDAFQSEANRIGVPPILLAAFAMQESSCNPNATGSGGTAGLLQLSPEKCQNVNCYDPAVNINIGANYLKTLLDHNPNIVMAVGMWNGWYEGMSFRSATAERTKSCYSQQNLDYLHQYFNGWLQGINPYTTRMGYYFNLDICQYIQNGYPTFSTSSSLRTTTAPLASLSSLMAFVAALSWIFVALL